MTWRAPESDLDETARCRGRRSPSRTPRRSALGPLGGSALGALRASPRMCSAVSLALAQQRSAARRPPALVPATPPVRALALVWRAPVLAQSRATPLAWRLIARVQLVC